MEEQYMQKQVIVKPHGPGTTLMKVSGILMIVFGAIALITQMIATAGMTLISAGIGAFSSEIESAELTTFSALIDSMGNSYLFATIAAVITIIAGILALVFARKLGKGMVVVIFCVLAIIMTLVSNITFFSNAGKITELLAQSNDLQGLETSFKFGFSNILSILASMVLPILAIVGYFKNKKAV